MRWLVAIGEWAVLLPVWRRVIKDPLWRIPAAVFSGLIVFVGILVSLIVTLAILFPAPSSAELDRRNERLMAPIPVYPESTLVEKYTFNDLRRVRGVLWNPLESYRTLTYLYFTSAVGTDADDVVAFYRRELVKAGWESQPGDFAFGGPYTFSKNDIDLYVAPFGDYPVPVPIPPVPNLNDWAVTFRATPVYSDFDVTPVASYADGQEFYFAISVAR